MNFTELKNYIEDMTDEINNLKAAIPRREI